MILHIFAKDLRRLWPWVLGLALLHFYVALAQIMVSPFPPMGSLRALRPLGGGYVAAQFLGHANVLLNHLLPAINAIGLLVFLLIVRMVQLDPLPGERQDWLARPVERRDLLATKLLFVILLIQGPMLGADLYQGLALGFSFADVLAASLSGNLTLFAAVSLPALAVGAMTRNLGQALGLGLAALAGALVLAWVIPALASFAGADFPPASDGVSAWVLKMLPVAAGAAIILRLQYFRRAARRSQAVLALCVPFSIAAQALLPAGAALAMDQWLSGAPRSSLSIAFAPQAGRPAAMGTPTNRTNEAITREGVTIYLPLRVGGVPAGAVLTGQAIRASLTTSDGKTLLDGLRGYLSQAQASSSDMPGRGGERGTAWNPAQPVYFVLTLPTDFVKAYAGQTLRLELDFSLMALRPLGAHELMHDGGEVRSADIGWCATSFNRWVQLSCLKPGAVPAGFSAQQLDQDGKPIDVVRLDTPPGPEHRDDVISRWGMSLVNGPFESLAAMPAAKPVAKVIITAYAPAARSVRHVTIADLRLGAWIGEQDAAMKIIPHE